MGTASLILKPMHEKLAVFSLLALLILQLSGCGFHLRGLDTTGSLSFESVQIEAHSKVREELVTALKRQLNYAKVEVIESQTAEVKIQLKATQYKVTRTSTRLGDATSQMLKMSQFFEVIDLASGEKVASGNSEVYRDRQINTAAALASDSELRSIQKSMSEELARQILNRIRLAMQAKNNPPKQVGE